MLSLTSQNRYWVCTDDVTLRYRHRGLREYIRGELRRDPRDGDVYVFLSRDFRRVRLYYFEYGGEVLTEKILHSGHFRKPVLSTSDKRVYHVSWEDFAFLVEGLIRTGREAFLEEIDEKGGPGRGSRKGAPEARK